MKLSDSRGIKSALWYTNELLRQEDINSLGDMQYQTVVDKYSALLEDRLPGAAYVIGGLQVHWNTALTLTLKAGIVVSKTGTYLESDTWGFVADTEKAFVVVVPQDASVGLTAGGALDRIDTIQIRPVVTPYNSKSRNFKDPVTGLISSALVPVRKEYTYEFMVLPGTEAVNPVAPAATAGWVKIAEVYVSAGYSAVAETSIVGYEYSNEWSAGPDTTKSAEAEIEATFYKGEARYDGLGFFNYGRHLSIAKWDSTHVVVVRDTGELFMLEFDGTDWTAVGKARLENRTGTDTFGTVIECTSSEVLVITSPNYYIYRITWDGNYFHINTSDVGSISPSPAFPRYCEFDATHFVLADDNADTVTMYERLEGSYAFIPIGTPLTKTGLAYSALCRLDATHIVLFDNATLDISVYNWNGSVFTLVGTPLTVPAGINSKLYAINSTTVVRCIPASSDNTRVYTWNGSTFTLAYTTQIGTTGDPKVAGLGTNQVAIGHNSGAFDYGTYYWNGSTLALVGNTIYTGGTATPEIVHLYGKYFAYADIGSDDLRTLEYYNKEIRQIGNALIDASLDSVAIPMARIDGHHIAATNRTTDTLDVFQWDGINWKKKTTLSLGTVTLSKLVAMNATDILVFNNSVAQVYRWDKSANTLTAIGNSLACETPSGASKVKGKQNEAFYFTNTGSGAYKYFWDGSSVLRVSDEFTAVGSPMNGLVLDDRMIMFLMGGTPFTKFYKRDYYDEGYFTLKREDDSINTRAQTCTLTLLDDDYLVVAWNRSAYIHVFKIS